MRMGLEDLFSGLLALRYILGGPVYRFFYSLHSLHSPYELS